MGVRKVTKWIRVTKQSIEEIRRDNREYFTALAHHLGEATARKAEREYLDQVERELATVAEGEFAEVSMVQINGDVG